MRPILLFLFVLYSQFLFSQVFVQTPAPFVEVQYSSVDFADVDGDGDQDVFIAGSWTSNLYLYDERTERYERSTTSTFAKVDESSAAFSDIDNDGDQDLLLSGARWGTLPTTRLYTNNGQGRFTEVQDTPFEDVYNGDIAFSDVDSDGDEDVFIIGTAQSETSSLKLYQNDGQGGFEEWADTPFEIEGCAYSGIAFSDVDGDGDEDVLLGTAFSGKLFTNDGSGTFSVVLNTPFSSGEPGGVAFADIDGDGDEDVITSGGWVRTNLYENDGQGNFSERTDSDFIQVWDCSVAFSDFDGDGDEDLLISGNTTTDFRQEGLLTKLYRNDGTGKFSEVENTPFPPMFRGDFAFADIEGDGDEDLVFTGTNIERDFGELYLNIKEGDFSQLQSTSLSGVEYSSVAFADIDGDEDEDVLITGQDVSGSSIAKLYQNNGQGNFEELANTPFWGVSYSSVAFSDIDGDEDEDVLITGQDVSGSSIAKLYQNNGQGNFEELANTPFGGVSNSSVAFSDMDGDGDEDVLITGQDTSGMGIAKLYQNNGQGNFEELTNTPFPGVSYGAVAFSDIDRDGDEDALITGKTNSGEHITTLFKNDGVGMFSEFGQMSLRGVAYSAVAFADVDGDGDEDLLITGEPENAALFENVTILYRNDGTGLFTEMDNPILKGCRDGAVAFSDMDGDGDEDLLITGYNFWVGIFSRLYENDGTGRYAEIEIPYVAVKDGSVAFSDIDGDGDEDVLITGSNANGRTPMAVLYRNDRLVTSIRNIQDIGSIPFHVYPNPVSGGWINVNLLAEKSRQIDVNVINLRGQILQQQREYLISGENTFSVDLSGLAKGVYLLQIKDDIKMGVRKIIVQ